MKLFWQSAKKLLPFCYNAIRMIRKKPADDEQLLTHIEYVLKLVEQHFSFN